MAGRGRYVYIQDDIDERLQKETNKSNLINNLLRDYFKQKDFDGLSEEELEAELKIIKLQKEMDKKIKEMRNGRV